jgi:hypothetical protein
MAAERTLFGAILALVLIGVSGLPKAEAQSKTPEVVGFGLPAESEFHWPFFIAKSPDVQKELKLSQEQVTAFDEVQAELKKSVADLGALKPAQAKAQVAKLTKWADETVGTLLMPEQQKRHRQIVWQVLEFNGGTLALFSLPAFAKEIGLSADQLKQGKKLEADYLAGWQKLVRANPGVGNGPIPGEAELAKKTEEAALKLLTSEQKKKWNEALGEPFKGEVKQFPIPGARPVMFKAPAEK